MASSLSLIISRFWFKVRGVLGFLSHEHLEDTVGLLTGLISIVVSWIERRGEVERLEWPVSEAVIVWLGSPSYMGTVCGPHKQL